MCTLTVHIREYFIAFPQDNNDFYGKKRNPSDKLYFSEKTKLPFTHFFSSSSSSSSKVETQVTQLKQVNRKQHSTTKQTLTKILIKKKSSYKNYNSYKFQMLLEQTQN